MCFRPADTHAHENGTAMTLPILLLPGIGGSGPDHWQSHWERTDPDMTRFAPSDWDRPELVDWCEALDRAVDALCQTHPGRRFRMKRDLSRKCRSSRYGFPA